MTEHLALVSACFGGIDDIKPFPRVDGVDTFLFLDEPARKAADPAALATWGQVIVPDYPRHDFSPRLRSKYFKLQIHRLPELESYRWLGWADTSLLFHDAAFMPAIVEWLAAQKSSQRIALLPHPERQTVREEYEFVRAQIAAGHQGLRLRYVNEKMDEQMRYFFDRGWNLDAPLWASGFWIIENSSQIAWCWDAWWHQNLRYGMMCQLSLPVMLAQFGLEPRPVHLNIYHNEFFEWIMHPRLM